MLVKIAYCVATVIALDLGAWGLCSIYDWWNAEDLSFEKKNMKKRSSSEAKALSLYYDEKILNDNLRRMRDNNIGSEYLTLIKQYVTSLDCLLPCSSGFSASSDCFFGLALCDLEMKTYVDGKFLYILKNHICYYSEPILFPKKYLSTFFNLISLKLVLINDRTLVIFYNGKINLRMYIDETLQLLASQDTRVVIKITPFKYNYIYLNLDGVKLTIRIITN